jgi:vacuolar-type H+-ATPase subunit I/STV1
VKDYLNINEAAKLTGLSIPTIRLKLERGLLPNASQVTQGQRKFWRIPLSDLISAGLLDKVTPVEEKAAVRSDALEIEIDRLRAELEHTKELLRRADKEIETYRPIVLNVLETRATQEKRRSLWQRLTDKG